MNSWQTFLASIRLSLPEISSFQRNINFYLKYPDIRSSHAPRHNRPIASSRATCAAHCTVATFFLSFFCYRAARVYGEGKKCGSRRLGPFIGPISFRVSVTKIGVLKIGISSSSLVEFLSYTRTLFKFKRDFFATRSLESYNTRNTRTLISSIVPDCVTQRCDDIDYKCTRLRIVNIGRSTINTIV